MLALGLVNVLIPEDALVLIALSDTPLGVSQLLKTLEKYLLSPLLPLRRRKLMRRRLVLVLGHPLPLESLQASSLIKLPLFSSLLLSLSAPEGRTHSMNWNDQVSAEESRDLASEVISAPRPLC